MNVLKNMVCNETKSYIRSPNIEADEGMIIWSMLMQQTPHGNLYTSSIYPITSIVCFSIFYLFDFLLKQKTTVYPITSFLLKGKNYCVYPITANFVWLKFDYPITLFEICSTSFFLVTFSFLPILQYGLLWSLNIIHVGD